MNRFQSFKQFYPYYLQEHRHPVCRRLHYTGSTLVLVIAGYALFTRHYSLLWWLPVCGYGFAWLGHMLFEHNRPATFRYPLYSFWGDWVMLKDACLSLFGFDTAVDHIPPHPDRHHH